LRPINFAEDVGTLNLLKQTEQLVNGLQIFEKIPQVWLGKWATIYHKFADTLYEPGQVQICVLAESAKVVE